jgi:hypothetical protein
MLKTVDRARISPAEGTSADTVVPEKSHYVILNGLRGVASLMVVVFHLFEAFSGAIRKNRS